MSAQRIVVVQGHEEPTRIPYFAPIARRWEVRAVNGAQELREALPGAQVLLGWDFRAGVLEQAWEAADALQWIQWSGAGVNAVLFDALARSPVVLTNARGIYDRAIAEYVLGCVLAMAKRLPQTLRLQARAEWKHRLSERIDARRVLVVGVGSIGRSIARLLASAGMRVEGVGRSARAADADFARIHGARDLLPALGTADYVVMVLPQTPETVGLFDAGALSAMRPGARLINVGRGSALDEDALVDALERGHLAGAALDVFASEPLPAESALWGREDVIVSPHMSGDYAEFTEALGWLIAQNFARFEQGTPLLNVVDKLRGY